MQTPLNPLWSAPQKLDTKLLGRIMYRHHNFEERLDIVTRLLSGEPISSICKTNQLDDKMVRQWLLRYKKYGEKGLKGTRSFNYSEEDKLAIVQDYQESQLSLQSVCLKYDLNLSTLKSWLWKIRNGKSLKNKHGRPPKHMGRPKKMPPQTELEILQAENLRLRAENALLKKVKTLVE